MKKGAANVEVLFPAGDEEERAGAVNDDAERGDPNYGSPLHAWRIMKSLNGFPDNGADSDEQQQGIEESRQDGSPPPSVGPARTRSFLRQFRGGPSHHEAEHISEVMAGIRQEGERVREKAEGDLEGNEAGIEENPYQKRPTKIHRRMMLMAMFVMVVAHAQRAP